LDLTAPSFVNYKKRCTRLAAASDKVYQLLAQGQWFSPGTPASSTTTTGRHDIAESCVKHQKFKNFNLLLWNCWTKLSQIWVWWSLCGSFSSWQLLLKMEISLIVYFCFITSQNELKF